MDFVAGARALIPFAAAKSFLQRAGGDIDAVSGGDLVVGCGVAELDNLPVTHGQDYAAVIVPGRPAENDVRARAAFGQAAGDEDGVQCGFAPGELEHAGRVHFTKNVKNLALAGD